MFGTVGFSYRHMALKLMNSHLNTCNLIIIFQMVNLIGSRSELLNPDSIVERVKDPEKVYPALTQCIRSKGAVGKTKNISLSVKQNANIMELKKVILPLTSG